MNLAAQDIRQNVGRFVLTRAGHRPVADARAGHGGIYQGLSFEATQLVDQIGADLWVGAKGHARAVRRTSPASGQSEISPVGRAGGASARSFVSHTVQREVQGKPLRMFVQGLDVAG